MSTTATIFILLLYAAFIYIVLLITRAFWLWFFRINEMVDTMKASLAVLNSIQRDLTNNGIQEAKQIFTSNSSSVSASSNQKSTRLSPPKDKIEITEPTIGGQHEFASLQWGTQYHETGFNFKQVSSWSSFGRNFELLAPNCNKLSWQTIDVESIEYGFIDGYYRWAALKASRDSKEDIYNKLRSLYGDSSIKSLGATIWSGVNTVIALGDLYGYKHNQALLLFMHNDVYKDKLFDLISMYFSEPQRKR